LFSTGVMLYELLTGSKPFQASIASAIIHNVINADPQPTTKLNAELPPGFDRIIKKALAKNLSHRYQTAREFQEDLRRVGAGQKITPSSQGKPWVLGAGVAAAVVVSAAAGWWVISSPTETVDVPKVGDST